MAQAQTIFINGVALQAKPVRVNGETYHQFKASDLNRAGAITAGGVTPKIEAIRGCIGDTLLNGVYTVQWLNVIQQGGRFGVTLKVANASKNELYNFMLFSPSGAKAATGAGQRLDLRNHEGAWLQKLLPGANTTVTTYSGNTTNVKEFTRLLIRPDPGAIRELLAAAGQDLQQGIRPYLSHKGGGPVGTVVLFCTSAGVVGQRSAVIGMKARVILSVNGSITNQCRLAPGPGLWKKPAVRCPRQDEAGTVLPAPEDGQA